MGVLISHILLVPFFQCHPPMQLHILLSKLASNYALNLKANVNSCGDRMCGINLFEARYLVRGAAVRPYLNRATNIYLYRVGCELTHCDTLFSVLIRRRSVTLSTRSKLKLKKQVALPPCKINTYASSKTHKKRSSFCFLFLRI